MPVKCEFVQDRGIYGKVPVPAFKPHALSMFAVFKDESRGWQIGQCRSGMSVMSMIPRHVQRSKRVLLDVIERMERERPDATALVGLVDGASWPDEIRPFGTELIEWARGL